LYVGAEGLVRGSAALALRLGLTPLVVGLTVVAFGTSSPELVVSVQASLNGNGAIALGNVIGSNICNVALILGLSAVIRPLNVHVQLLRLDLPLMLLASVLLALLLLDGGLGRPEGLLLTASLVLYTAFNIWKARREHTAVQQEFAEVIPPVRAQPWRDVLFIIGGISLLVGGAHLLVKGAVIIAEGLGLSQAVIGLTIIAVGTSLPELATSLVAAARGEGDIAIGNVVGSNVFNILAILGLAALLHPLYAQEIGLIDLGVMTAFALLMLPLMRSGFRLTRWEGALLLGLYVAYLVYLLP
jgi:cation:H+ antiporter